MGIELTWDADSENVIRYDFPVQWGWHDFLNGFEHSLEMAQTLHGARYDVIGNFLESPHLPPGSGITHVFGVFKRTLPNCGVTVVVTHSAFIRALMEVLFKVHPETRRAFALAGSLEEARSLIAQARATAGDSA